VRPTLRPSLVVLRSPEGVNEIIKLPAPSKSFSPRKVLSLNITNEGICYAKNTPFQTEVRIFGIFILCIVRKKIFHMKRDIKSFRLTLKRLSDISDFFQCIFFNIFSLLITIFLLIKTYICLMSLCSLMSGVSIEKKYSVYFYESYKQLKQSN